MFRPWQIHVGSLTDFDQRNRHNVYGSRKELVERRTANDSESTQAMVKLLAVKTSLYDYWSSPVGLRADYDRSRVLNTCIERLTPREVLPAVELLQKKKRSKPHPSRKFWGVFWHLKILAKLSI